jgi:hypothetical protein
MLSTALLWIIMQQDMLMQSHVVQHRLTGSVHHNLLHIALPEIMEDIPLQHCFPNFFASGSLMASKSNHGSSHPSLCKYSVWMKGIQNSEICISELILDSYKYITVAYITLTLINMTVIHFVGTEVS